VSGEGIPLAGRPRPLTCLVTDGERWLADAHRRRRDPSLPTTRDLVLARVEAAVAAGLDLVQVREHALAARDLRALVSTCVELARGTDTLIVVNDRADVALAAGAQGVHLRASSFPAMALRRGVPAGFLVGRSVHGLEEAAAELVDGADYLVAGTVFPSRSKPPGHPLIGPQGLAAVVARVRMPVLAIGGISVGAAAAVAAAGAAGIAAVDLFGELDGEVLRARLRSLRDAFRQVG
jgi:thiamine-phosphate pyrophosphorylase